MTNIKVHLDELPIAFTIIIVCKGATQKCIEELQAEPGCWVFGLTARYCEMASVTSRVLKSLGVDLDRFEIDTDYTFLLLHVSIFVFLGRLHSRRTFPYANLIRELWLLMVSSTLMPLIKDWF